MFRFIGVWCVALVASSASALAQGDFKRIESRSEFVALVQGKTLSRPLIKLSVSPNGKISGRGVRWDVTGSWRWENGFFCRDLFWGGDDLGYNCQEVRASDTRMRFTSDRGAGDSADFRLR